MSTTVLTDWAVRSVMPAMAGKRPANPSITLSLAPNKLPIESALSLNGLNGARAV
ncbi:hypothetical protein D3C76_1886670 [compost metagenome]